MFSLWPQRAHTLHFNRHLQEADFSYQTSRTISEHTTSINTRVFGHACEYMYGIYRLTVT